MYSVVRDEVPQAAALLIYSICVILKRCAALAFEKFAHVVQSQIMQISKRQNLDEFDP